MKRGVCNIKSPANILPKEVVGGQTSGLDEGEPGIGVHELPHARIHDSLSFEQLQAEVVTLHLPHAFVKEDDHRIALHFGALGAEAQSILVSGTLEPLLHRLLGRIFGADVASEVEQNDLPLSGSYRTNRKVLRLRVNIGVNPLIAALFEQLSKRLARVHPNHELLTSNGCNHV